MLKGDHLGRRGRVDALRACVLGRFKHLIEIDRAMTAHDCRPVTGNTVSGGTKPAGYPLSERALFTNETDLS